MAKKQTRRSISVSRTTYERLKAFCETNNISMSQFVETRVGDFLGSDSGTTSIIPAQPRPTSSVPAPTPARPASPAAPAKSETSGMRPTVQQVPMTSAAARFAVEPPPPVIKRREPADENAPKPVEKRPEQIFTF
jgi:hypothetical protein